MRLAPLVAVLLLPLAVTGTPACAADAAEIAFWESVRDSKDAAELQAYLQRYPNGDFAVLARRRLSALQSAPAPQRPAAPAIVQPQGTPPTAAVTGSPHALQPGDAWTYRLSYPRLRGEWGRPDRAPVTQVVTLTSVEPGRILDVLTIDGGTAFSTTHESSPTLLTQGADIFSPYPFALGKMQGGRWFRSVVNAESACANRFKCEAKARIVGNEPVVVPAGTFLATKVVVEEEWLQGAGQLGARWTGGRTLTIWYAPEIGRAVKYSSRITVGDQMPVDPTFDLDLVSFRLK